MPPVPLTSVYPCRRRRLPRPRPPHLLLVHLKVKTEHDTQHPSFSPFLPETHTTQRGGIERTHTVSVDDESFQAFLLFFSRLRRAVPFLRFSRGSQRSCISLLKILTARRLQTRSRLKKVFFLITGGQMKEIGQELDAIRWEINLISRRFPVLPVIF